MKTLFDLCQDPEKGPLFSSLVGDSLYPTDKMDVSKFKRLIQQPLLDLLKNESSSSAQGLLRYLQAMQFLYRGCFDNKLTQQEQRTKLEFARDYFQNMMDQPGKGGRITENLMEQIRMTVDGMIKMREKFPDLRSSALGTLIVENFFSQVRSKIMLFFFLFAFPFFFFFSFFLLSSCSGKEKSDRHIEGYE